MNQLVFITLAEGGVGSGDGNGNGATTWGMRAIQKRVGHNMVAVEWKHSKKRCKKADGHNGDDDGVFVVLLVVVRDQGWFFRHQTGRRVL